MRSIVNHNMSESQVQCSRLKVENPHYHFVPGIQRAEVLIGVDLTPRDRWLRLAIWLLVCLFIGPMIGCSDRAATTDATLDEIDESLLRGEGFMQEAGVAIDFREIDTAGTLSDLRSFLPAPGAIADVEQQARIEEAIRAFHEVQDGFAAAGTMAPLTNPVEISTSDSMLLHLHTGYLYALSAVSRLARTGDDLYSVAFRELGDDRLEVYHFELTLRAERLIDSVDLDEDPFGIIRIFNERQRQAIIDALMLLIGAEVVIASNPEEGIKHQEPGIDPLYGRSNALTELERGAQASLTLTEPIHEALEELEQIIADGLSKGMLDDVRRFGFTVRWAPAGFEEGS